MDVENPIFKLIDRLDIVHKLPDEVGWVIIDAEIAAGDDLEHTPPKRRGVKEVLPAGPLVRAKEHGAVLNGNTHLFLLRIADNLRPHLGKQFQILLRGLTLVPSNEGGDHIDSQPVGRVDQPVEVLNIRPAFFQIRVKRVRIKGQGGYFHLLFPANPLYIGLLAGVQVRNIQMAYARIPALRLALGPARQLHALEPVFTGKIHDLFKIVILKD